MGGVLLISTSLSGCVVPYIVTDIVDEVQAGKRLEAEERSSTIGLVKQYILAENQGNKELIAQLSTETFSAQENSTIISHSVKRTWNHEVTIHDNIAVIWASYGLYSNNMIVECGKQVFNLKKGNNNWKVAHSNTSKQNTVCKNESTQG
jgi:hypothetical protein